MNRVMTARDTFMKAHGMFMKAHDMGLVHYWVRSCPLMTFVMMSSWRGHELVMKCHKCYDLACVVVTVHDDVMSTHDLVITAISSCAAMGTHDNSCQLMTTHDNLIVAQQRSRQRITAHSYSWPAMTSYDSIMHRLWLKPSMLVIMRS